MEPPEKEFMITINKATEGLCGDINLINERDCYAFELSMNNILLKPEERWYMENKNNNYRYYCNALRVIKIPKGNIKIDKKEYLTTRLSPYTYPECILIMNGYQNDQIIFDKTEALKKVRFVDTSDL